MWNRALRWFWSMIPAFPGPPFPQRLHGVWIDRERLDPQLEGPVENFEVFLESSVPVRPDRSVGRGTVEPGPDKPAPLFGKPRDAAGHDLNRLGQMARGGLFRVMLEAPGDRVTERRQCPMLTVRTRLW